VRVLESFLADTAERGSIERLSTLGAEEGWNKDGDGHQDDRNFSHNSIV
jgi:hypothetical protein